MTWVIANIVGGTAFTTTERALNRYGISIYVPVSKYYVTKRGQRKPELVERPAFGSYIFVPKTPGWEKILYLDNVISFLTRLDKVIDVSDSIIDMVKMQESMGEFDRVEMPNGQKKRKSLVRSLSDLKDLGLDL